MCNLCSENCESVSHFLRNFPAYSERHALFLEQLKNNFGKEFEHFKSCDVAGKSRFILGTEVWGSNYEELLCIAKSYIYHQYRGIVQIKAMYMALSLVSCSIGVDQGGTLYARAKVSLVSWEGERLAVLLMVPLGPPGKRPMAQALWLPFGYYSCLHNNTHLWPRWTAIRTLYTYI